MISLKPDQRQVDLLVQTRQHLLPNTVLGLLQKLKGDRPEGAILLCTPYISPKVAEMCREQNVSYLDGVKVVSPLQLYLDLMKLSGRGKDAAEEVFDRELRPPFAAGNAKSESDQ